MFPFHRRPGRPGARLRALPSSIGVLFALVLGVASGCSGSEPSSPSAQAGSGGSLPAIAGASSGGSGVPTGGSAPAHAGSVSGGAGETSSATGGAAGASTGGQAGGGSGVTGGAGSGSGGSAGAGGAAGSGGQGGQSARGKATMVIRGAGTPTAGDQLMIGRIQAFGYQQVVTIKDADATAQAVAGSALVVISSSAESAPLADRLKDIAIPVLCIEDAEFKLMGMTTSGTHDAGTTQLAAVAGGSALVGGLTGTVTISTKAGELGWGTPAASAMIGATMLNDPSHVVVFGYAAGAQMSTMVAPARRAGFAIREDLAANLNPNGIKIFDAILAWVAQ